MLEKRFERGGTLATDDYSTPFQYNLAQFELPLADELPPYRDLDLHSQGVRFVRPEIVFAVTTSRREELTVGRGGRGLGAEIEEMLAAASARGAAAPLSEPGRGGRGQGGATGEPASTLADATPRTLAERAADTRAGVVLRYACGLAGFLDGDVPLGLIGAFCVARLFSPAIVVGGSKNLANGLARVAAAAGARGLVSLRGHARRGRRRRRSGCARAVGGETEARAVVSTLDPRSTFLELMAPELAPAELREAASNWIVEDTGPFTAHFGIKGDPPGGERADPHLRLRERARRRAAFRDRPARRAAGDGRRAPHRGQRP